MVTMVLMVTVAKANNFWLQNWYAGDNYERTRIALNFYFKLAIFSTHTPQILGSIFKLREIINLKPVKLVGIRPMPMQ